MSVKFETKKVKPEAISTKESIILGDVESILSAQITPSKEIRVTTPRGKSVKELVKEIEVRNPWIFRPGKAVQPAAATAPAPATAQPSTASASAASTPARAATAAKVKSVRLTDPVEGGSVERQARLTSSYTWSQGIDQPYTVTVELDSPATGSEQIEVTVTFTDPNTGVTYADRKIVTPQAGATSVTVTGNVRLYQGTSPKAYTVQAAAKLVSPGTQDKVQSGKANVTVKPVLGAQVKSVKLASPAEGTSTSTSVTLTSTPASVSQPYTVTVELDSPATGSEQIEVTVTFKDASTGATYTDKKTVTPQAGATSVTVTGNVTVNQGSNPTTYTVQATARLVSPTTQPTIQSGIANITIQPAIPALVKSVNAYINWISSSYLGAYEYSCCGVYEKYHVWHVSGYGDVIVYLDRPATGSEKITVTLSGYGLSFDGCCSTTITLTPKPGQTVVEASFYIDGYENSPEPQITRCYGGGFWAETTSPITQSNSVSTYESKCITLYAQ